MAQWQNISAWKINTISCEKLLPIEKELGGNQMTLQNLADGVILVGAVVIAAWNILKACGAIGKKVEDNSEDFVKEILENEADKYFAEYTEKRKSYLDGRIITLTEPICDVFNERFDTLETMIGQIQDDLSDVQDQNSDMLRRELKKVYHKYRHYKKIPQYDYDDCQKMMADYTGNSYAEDMWNRIKQFEVVEDDDFLDE